MKRSYLIALLLLPAFVFSSCKKEEPEERIAGVWRFEKVTYMKDFSLRKTDLTDIYKNIRLTFYNDRTFLYEHSGRKLELTGLWEMGSDVEQQGESSVTVTYLDWYGEDPHGNYEEVKWNHIAFSKKGLRASEKKYGGNYNYLLVKE